MMPFLPLLFLGLAHGGQRWIKDTREQAQHEQQAQFLTQAQEGIDFSTPQGMTEYALRLGQNPNTFDQALPFLQGMQKNFFNNQQKQNQFQQEFDASQSLQEKQTEAKRLALQNDFYKQWRGESGDYGAKRASYDSLLNSLHGAENAFDTLVNLYQFMGIVEPGMAVRQEDHENFANSFGFGGMVEELKNTAAGDALSVDTREAIAKSMHRYMTQYHNEAVRLGDEYKTKAGLRGLDPERVLGSTDLSRLKTWADFGSKGGGSKGTPAGARSTQGKKVVFD